MTTPTLAKPAITEQLTGYTFTWLERGLTIRVTKVRVHTSDGRVTGEVMIESLDPDGKSIVIYPPAQFNFTAPRTRVELAKTLAAKFPLAPWGEMVDQLCFGVQARARQGEPVRELWTSADIPDMEYLLKPILIKGVPSMIFGEKGVGKSTLALLFYTCLILPWDENPLGLTVPARSVKTLILDYELPGAIAQRNAKYLQNGMGLPPFPLYHRRCRVPLADDLEQIANQIDELKAEVVIIDSLARASGGDLNKTEGANAFFEALDKLNVTSLIIAQTSKDTESKHKTPYGNALFTYFARSIFEVCKAETIEDDSISIGLFHRWSNLTKNFPAMGARICYNGHHTKIESQPISVSDFMGKVSSQKAILEELTGGALSVKDLTERIGGNESTVRVILSKLKKKGLVLNVESGKWGLSAR